MPLFIQEAVDDKLSKKTTVIPKQIHDLALQVKGEYGNNKTQDGYKTVNRLLDASYNKGKKNTNGISSKENLPKMDNNDGLVKFPTSAARKMIIDLKKETNFINPKAKDTIINYLQSDVKAKESAVKANKTVPKVPKASKPYKINQPNRNKQLTINGTKINMKENKKKIFISESKLLLLKEYYTQLNIPFNHDTPDYDYKSVYEHYIDFLEKYGKYGKLPKSKLTKNDVYDIVQEETPNAFEILSSNDGETEHFIELFTNIIMSRGVEFATSLFDDDFIKQFNEDGNDNFSDYLKDIIYIEGSYESYLNEEGERLYQKYLNDYYLERLEDYGFPYSLIFDNRGLIYVERAIKVPSVYDRQKTNDFINNYDSLGECWSWAENGAEPYCGASNYTTLTLKGWVDPSNVDWLNTISKNMYSLNEEQELYIPNALVEVFEANVFINHKEVKLPLHNTILMKA